MGTNDDKYLILRGKNKDIYFIQKRVSKKISSIIGKEFIKKSLETSDILVAREKRDTILKELKEIELKEFNKNVPISKEVIDVTQALNHLVNIEDPFKKPNLKTYEYKNKDISTKNTLNKQNVLTDDPQNSENDQISKDFYTNNDLNLQKVPIEPVSNNGNESKDARFTFINHSKLPQKDSILAFIDKITPLAIIILVIFVFFSV